MPVGKHIPGVFSLLDLVIRGLQPVFIECKLEGIGREMHVPDGAEKVRDGNLSKKKLVISPFSVIAAITFLGSLENKSVLVPTVEMQSLFGHTARNSAMVFFESCFTVSRNSKA